MKLKKKIIVTMMIILGVNLMAVSLYGNIYFKKTKDSLIEHDFKTNIEIVNRYIDKEKDKINAQMYEYARWTETYDAIENKDEEWILENIDALYKDETYNVDFIYIEHNTNGYKHLLVDNMDDKFFESNIYLNLEREESYISGFYYLNRELYLISGGKVEDTEGINNNGKIFIGRKMEFEIEEAIKEGLEGARINFIDKELLFKEDYKFNNDNSNLIFYYPLKDYIDANTINIEVNKNLKSHLGDIDENFISLVIIEIIFYISTFMAIYLYIQKTTKELELVIDQIDYIAKGNYKARINSGDSEDIKILGEHINKLAKSVENKIEKLEIVNMETIQLLVNTIEAKDKYTKGHSERVSYYAVEIGKILNVKNLKTLSICGALHDIGKIGIAEEILNKPGKLTDIEFEIIKAHPEKGFMILDGSSLFNEVKDGVLYHHERYDGKGYPKGLSGELIPLAARILAVADTFDAMTSQRSYRKAMEKEVAINIIKSESTKQFDPLVVEAFLKFISK